MSSPLDFGAGTLFDGNAFTDPCKTGRIMIINSIALWDMNARTAYSDKTDVMTVTVTVNDATVQAMRLSGILKLIRGLPSIQRLVDHPKTVFPAIDHSKKASKKGVKLNLHDDVFTKHSAVGNDVRSCAEQQARQYIDDHTSAEDKIRIQKEGLKE